jgi:hypothetical protein
VLKDEVFQDTHMSPHPSAEIFDAYPELQVLFPRLYDLTTEVVGAAIPAQCPNADDVPAE